MITLRDLLRRAPLLRVARPHGAPFSLSGMLEAALHNSRVAEEVGHVFVDQVHLDPLLDARSEAWSGQIERPEPYYPVRDGAAAGRPVGRLYAHRGSLYQKRTESERTDAVEDEPQESDHPPPLWVSQAFI